MERGTEDSRIGSTEVEMVEPEELQLRIPRIVIKEIGAS